MQKLPGILIVTLSTFFYALLFPMLKKANEKLPPFTVMAVSMFVLFFISLIFSLIFENSTQIKFTSFKPLIGLLILVGVINVVSFWLEILGYKFMPLWQQTMFTLLTPIFAGIASYFILGEAISPKLFLGLLIMGVGLFVAIR